MEEWMEELTFLITLFLKPKCMTRHPRQTLSAMTLHGQHHVPQGLGSPNPASKVPKVIGALSVQNQSVLLFCLSFSLGDTWLKNLWEEL